MLRVAINGFGRIGRLVTKKLFENSEIEIVAINDLANAATMRHLFKYDSTFGVFENKVEINEEKNTLCISKGEKTYEIKILSEPQPENLPWGEIGIDLVLESSGRFRDWEKAGKHIKAGAKQVMISAPAKEADIPTVVLGVNDQQFDFSSQIFSNASCTTNCLAPIVKILDEEFGFEEGIVSTVHAYTADQNILDAPHRKDLRRARTAANNIIPTTTGAAKATIKVLPHLEGKLTANAYRVPVQDGSLTDVVCKLRRQPSLKELNAFFNEASKNDLKGILQYTDDPIVSNDIIGNPHSSILDSGLTIVQEELVKIVAWYDNESGYSHRLIDVMRKVARN